MRELEAFEILHMIVDEMGIPTHRENLKSLTHMDFQKIRALCLAAASLLATGESDNGNFPDMNLHPVDSNTQCLTDHIKNIEKNTICGALKKTKFNKTKAAELLGLTLRQLRYKLEIHGIR